MPRKRTDPPAATEPAPNSPWGGPSTRGLKVRQRDDYGVELFRRALDSLTDPGSLSRALLELSRIYDPITNGPLLSQDVRRQVLALVEQSQTTQAQALLETVLRTYTHRGEPPAPVPPEPTPPQSPPESP